MLNKWSFLLSQGQIWFLNSAESLQGGQPPFSTRVLHREPLTLYYLYPHLCSRKIGTQVPSSQWTFKLRFWLEFLVTKAMQDSCRKLGGEERAGKKLNPVISAPTEKHCWYWGICLFIKFWITMKSQSVRKGRAVGRAIMSSVQVPYYKWHCDCAVYNLHSHITQPWLLALSSVVLTFTPLQHSKSVTFFWDSGSCVVIILERRGRDEGLCHPSGEQIIMSGGGTFLFQSNLEKKT